MDGCLLNVAAESSPRVAWLTRTPQASSAVQGHEIDIKGNANYVGVVTLVPPTGPEKTLYSTLHRFSQNYFYLLDVPPDGCHVDSLHHALLRAGVGRVELSWTPASGPLLRGACFHELFNLPFPSALRGFMTPPSSGGLLCDCP